MYERQFDPQGYGRWDVWVCAKPLIAAALGAHIVVLISTISDAPNPWLVMLATTVVFAGISLAYGISGRMIVSTQPVALQMRAGVLALVIVGAGVWVLGRFLGTGEVFYCVPLVPWRIEIALFGSFSLGCFTVMARARQRGWMVYPGVMISLLWIAPFYGFFSAPLFLGISLNTVCPDRPVTTVIIAALSMMAGEQCGRAIAGWLSGGNT